MKRKPLKCNSKKMGKAKASTKGAGCIPIIKNDGATRDIKSQHEIGIRDNGSGLGVELPGNTMEAAAGKSEFSGRFGSNFPRRVRRVGILAGKGLGFK